MNKVVAAIALLSASSVMATGTDCTDNKKLATAFGVSTTGFLTSSAAVTGLKYCTNLAADSCCPADVINAFQDNANTVRDRVATEVGKRDQFLIETRKTFLDDIVDDLVAVKKAAAAAVTKLASVKLTDETVTDFEEQVDFLTGGVSDLVSTFAAYQKSRATCAKAAIELQAAAWCLACDPTAGTNGGDGAAGTIALSDTTKTSLESSCYAYLTNAAEQNLILKFKYVSDKLTAYTTALNKIATDGDQASVNSFKTLISSNAITSPPTDDNKTPVTLPTACTSSSDCDYITSSLWNPAGGLDEDILAAGGILIDYTASSGNEEETENESETETQGGARILATGSFTPVASNVGVTVTFPENPGSVVNKGAQLIEGAVVCAGVLAMGLLI